MPKKKLTKAQVKRKMKLIFNNLYDLEMDKLGQISSFVPMSIGKLMEFADATRRAIKRL